MKTTVKLEGFEQASQVLYALSQKEAQKIGRSVLRKAARQILLAVREASPVWQGRLKKALTVEVDRGQDRSWIFANVKVKKVRQYRDRLTRRKTVMRGKGANRKLAQAAVDYQIGSTPEVYGAFQEFGVPSRNIAPLGFMRKAWDTEGGRRALFRIGAELGKSIEEMAEILSRRGG